MSSIKLKYCVHFSIRILLGVSLLIGFLSCKEKKMENTINIAVAANMQYALEEIVKDFTENTGISCQIIVSSSGKHTAQIMEGAPYDIFISADMNYPNQLYEKGFTLTAPEVYAYGELVLWSMTEINPISLKNLTDENIRHIAVANPMTAPYGKAAMEMLSYHKLLDSIRHKLVFGESIAQTNQFIYSKSAEIGVTSLSTIKSKKLINTGSWMIIDDISYTPIAQGVVILTKLGDNKENAIAFKNYLLSKNANEILKEYGYFVNE